MVRVTSVGNVSDVETTRMGGLTLIKLARVDQALDKGRDSDVIDKVRGQVGQVGHVVQGVVHDLNVHLSGQLHVLFQGRPGQLDPVESDRSSKVTMGGSGRPTPADGHAGAAVAAADVGDDGSLGRVRVGEDDQSVRGGTFTLLGEGSDQDPVLGEGS